MLELLWLLLSFAGFAAGLILSIRLFARAPHPLLRSLLADGNRRQIFDTGPAEPCWSEEIFRDSLYSYARSQCPNDLLMELDARARRRDFPIPISHE